MNEFPCMLSIEHNEHHLNNTIFHWLHSRIVYMQFYEGENWNIIIKQIEIKFLSFSFWENFKTTKTPDCVLCLKLKIIIK